MTVTIIILTILLCGAIWMHGYASGLHAQWLKEHGE